MWTRIKDSLPEPGRLSAVPADWIEKVYLSKSSSFVKECKVRLYYAGLFLPAVAIDFGVSLAGTARSALKALVGSDDARVENTQEFILNTTIASKNAYALLASPLGVFNPKLIQLHFAMPKVRQGIVSGGHTHHVPDVTVLHPDSVEQIQEIIRGAARGGVKIMPVGAGFSQGKQFIPEGKNGERCIAIDLSKFDTVQIDAANKTATIGAGVLWHVVQTQADKHGLALTVMQASNVFSAGGSVGTNVHGWDHLMGMLSNAITCIVIINAQGEVQTLTPDMELFHYVTGGFGLFGIVVSITIKLTENELLQEIGTEVPLADYARYFYERVLPDENIRLNLYRLSLDPNDIFGQGVAVNYTRVNTEVRKERTPSLVQESTYGSRNDQIMANLARRIPWVRKHYWESEYKRLLSEDAPHPETRNAIMKPTFNPIKHEAWSEAEWLQEYFLPADRLANFVQALGRLLMENQVRLLNASIRFVKENKKPPMSTAPNGDRFALVICFTQVLQQVEKIEGVKWILDSQDLALFHGGTFYLPYQHISHPEAFLAGYPLAREVLRKKLEVDPNEIFSSGFYLKYIEPLKNDMAFKPTYFHQLVKDEATKERFAGFLKVVLKRIKPDQLYKLLEDILKYKDTHAEIYKELCERLPEIAPNAIQDFRLILESLSTIKEDLAEQAYNLLDDDGVTEINGLVEIGYPGRFINGLKGFFKVTGPTYAVFEGPALSDIVQTGIRRPYQKFAKLNYNEPDLHTISDHSIDLMTCYVGLHHIPENKLKKFLEEIARVLRPGGHFLLVDHDVRDEEELLMAHGAHMIFNVVNKVSVEEEMSEIRLFKPMTEWQRLLEEAGLQMGVGGPQVEMIREDDPTRNRMVCFTRSPALELSFVEWRRDRSVSLSSAKEAMFSSESSAKDKQEMMADSEKSITMAERRCPR